MNLQRNTDFCKAFGSNLKKIRIENGFTLRGFALEAGIEHSQLSKIERGAINPTISTVLVIADTLKMPVKDLFDFKFVNKGK